MPKWMISYRFKIEGDREHEDAVQIIDEHPASYIAGVNAMEGYTVTRVYSAIEIPPKTLTRSQFELFD